MKRVLLTGGSRGLGVSICRALAESGYCVSTISRTRTTELEKAINDFPTLIQPCFADLSSVGELSGIYKELRAEDGFDGFIANAAVGTDGLLTLTPQAKIEECIQLNLVSTILLAREVLKGMIARGGSLVFISSISAIRGYAGLSVYSATKGALLSFSRSLAHEYGPRSIRSNCLLPGFMETEMTGSLSPEDRDRIRQRTPLHRLGQPLDVAGMVKFLLSDEARFITGAEFVIDGGLTA